MDKYYQQKRIQDNQKFILKLLHLRIGSYYPLRSYLGIDYKGKIDEITNLSIAYNAKKVKKGYQVTREYQQPDLGYKINLVLDKIPQIALLPALLQPAYGLGALAFFFLTQTTYQPSGKDNSLVEVTPTTNYGAATPLWMNNRALGLNAQRPILEFDISDIPANATFSQGDLQLYHYNNYSAGRNPNGKQTDAFKLTRTDWVETESTWLIYKTDSSWTTAGGDFVTTNPSGGSTNFGEDYGWLTWNILAITQDAYSNSNSVEVLVKFTLENAAPGSETGANFHSREYTDNTSLRPKLTVTYTVPSVTGAAFLLNFC